MPGSESPETTGALPKGYGVAVVLAGLALVAYGLFNILVDPTGQFGQAGRYPFNRALPAQTVAYGEANGDPSFYGRALRDSDATTILIGTSRTLQGFDVCARPDMLRIARPGYAIEHLARLEHMALRNRSRPITLLIEVGMPQTPRPASSGVNRKIFAALSPHEALQAAGIVRASLAGEGVSPAYTPCRPTGSSHHNWAEAGERLRLGLTVLNASPSSLADGRARLMKIADDADRICMATGVRHRLIFFSLPVSSPGSPVPALNRLMERNTGRISEAFSRRRAPAGGCDIQYRNHVATPPGSATGQAAWRDRAEWLDYTHFSPRLGAIALDSLIEE